MAAVSVRVDVLSVSVQANRALGRAVLAGAARSVSDGVLRGLGKEHPGTLLSRPAC